MSADLDTQRDAADATSAARGNSRAWFLLAAAAWNIWIWVTRLINLSQDTTPRTTGFVVVHAVLYVGSFAFAIGLGVIGWRMRRESRQIVAR